MKFTLLDAFFLFSIHELVFFAATTHGLTTFGYNPRHESVLRFPPEPPSTTSEAATSSLSQSLNIPHWLETLKNNNEIITTSQGLFKLGQGPECFNTPIKTTTGVCKIIFDCPEVFSLLTDIDVYLEYFCPLNKYAGVCCPVKTDSPDN